MMKLKYQAIIFDFDGVLAESVNVKTQAFAQMYACFGEEMVSKVVAYHLENGGVSRLEKFRYYHETILKQPISDQEREFLGQMFSRLVFDAVVAAPWVDGAYEFLDAFHQRVKLFVASGTPEEELKAVVASRGMDRFFVSVHGSPSTKSEIIREICRRHQLDPQRVLMVGDSMTDHRGAMSAGVAFIGRNSGEGAAFPQDITVLEDLRLLPYYII